MFKVPPLSSCGLRARCSFCAEQYSIVGVYCSLFMYLPPEWRLGCFQILTIMNKVSINIMGRFFYVDISFQYLWVSTKWSCWIVDKSMLIWYETAKPSPQWLSQSSSCFRSSPEIGLTGCQVFEILMVVYPVLSCIFLMTYVQSIYIASLVYCLLPS